MRPVMRRCCSPSGAGGLRCTIGTCCGSASTPFFLLIPAPDRALVDRAGDPGMAGMDRAADGHTRHPVPGSVPRSIRALAGREKAVIVRSEVCSSGLSSAPRLACVVRVVRSRYTTGNEHPDRPATHLSCASHRLLVLARAAGAVPDPTPVRVGRTLRRPAELGDDTIAVGPYGLMSTYSSLGRVGSRLVNGKRSMSYSLRPRVENGPTVARFR